MFDSRRPHLLFSFGVVGAAAAGLLGHYSPAYARAIGARETVTRAGAPSPARRSVAGLRFVVAPSGNEVRYRVHEQLARLPLPSDAVGATTEIGGGISFAADGKVIPADSKFLINIGSLTSDRDMRDNYIRRRVLETEQYPQVAFTPTAIRGLPTPLPTSGTHSFELIGDLTVHGVTKPTTWAVTATGQNNQVTGSASTSFTFDDFGLHKPSVPIVLSAADTIRLEYDFTLVPKSN